MSSWKEGVSSNGFKNGALAPVILGRRGKPAVCRGFIFVLFAAFLLVSPAAIPQASSVSKIRVLSEQELTDMMIAESVLRIPLLGNFRNCARWRSLNLFG